MSESIFTKAMSALERRLGKKFADLPGNCLPMEAILACVGLTLRRERTVPIYLIRDDGRALGKVSETTVEVALHREVELVSDRMTGDIVEWRPHAVYPSGMFWRGHSRSYYHTLRISFHEKGIILVLTGDRVVQDFRTAPEPRGEGANLYLSNLFRNTNRD